MSDPGNTLNTALNLGNLTTTRTFKDFVGTVDRIDVYRFTLRQTSNLSLELSGLSDNAQIYLIADLNNNGQLDYSETLYDDYASSYSGGVINSSLGAGTYFAWVDTYSINNNTNYTLSLSAIASPPTTPSNPGNTFNTALNIGNLSGTRTFKDFVGTVDRDDVYRFNLTQTSNLSLELSGLSDNAQISLIADLNNNGQLDYSPLLSLSEFK